MRGVHVQGDMIRRLRAERGFTQEQLAAQVDCDVTTLRKMEKGGKAFDFRSVVALAQALDCELNELVLPPEAKHDRRDLHLEIVRKWHEAFLACDLEALISLHTEDTVLEIPAAEGLPAAGNFHGIDALKEHMHQIFQLFRVRNVSEDDFVIHAAENIVFLRTTATIEYLPTGKSYTSRHFNEFEFRDSRIMRRTVIADYGGLRGVLD